MVRKKAGEPPDAAEPARWFITDKAIEDAGRDAFGHDDVAGQLVAIIEALDPPATIGLLGGFGTGKSSIGNLLSQRLSGHPHLRVVSLSAEKHSETARQRGSGRSSTALRRLLLLKTRHVATRSPRSWSGWRLRSR